MKTSMRATKAMTYATRRLKAGDEFRASRRDARILSALGRAEYATWGMVAAPAEPVAPENDLAALRAQYQEVMGKRPYHGWDADELRERMAQADES